MMMVNLPQDPEIAEPLVTTAGETDRLFAEDAYPRPFEFNQAVAEVFDDMISRSVPLYREVTVAVADWLRRYCVADDLVFDVGCSTGTTLEMLARCFKALGRPIRLGGIDPSEAMVERASAKLAGWEDYHDVDVRVGDIATCPLQPTKAFVMNYTLQFIPLAQRGAVLRRLCDNLDDSGLLILSEKIRSERADLHEAQTLIYESFKRRRGYSKSEIERKKESLERVLIPLTVSEQVALLKDAGFTHVELIIKWHNFATFVALKR